MALDKETKQILTYVAVAGGTYFFVLKPILIKLGILKSDTQLAQESSQKQNIQDYLNYSPNGLSKPIGDWQIIADTIYNDLNGLAIFDNVNDAIYQLCRVQTEDDVKALISCFGSRQVTAFGYHYGTSLMLPQFVLTSLSNSEINTVNDNYTRKGIKFRF